MKTKKCHRKTILLWSVLFFLQSFSLSSQQLGTLNWRDFVGSSSNYLVCDTFLRQTFEQKEYDLWEYSTTGNPSLFNASVAGIKGQEGSYSLKLPIGSSVRFENPYPIGNSTISVKFAAYNLRADDGLLVSTLRDDGPRRVIWALSRWDRFDIHYGQLANGETGHSNMSNPIGVNGNPQYITLESISSKPAEGNSFFCIDEVYGYREVASYSLFKGEGAWTDHSNWSHLSPVSRQKALVEGVCQLDQPVSCSELHLKGELVLERDGICEVENCYLYGNGSFNFKGGTIRIKNELCVSLELPEKGEWYFFSLPFDVYPDGLDSVMQWGSDSVAENGNYFYLMTYNSESRGKNGLTSSNWEQVSSLNYQPDKPVIEKYKGYLIALDQDSDRQQLTFVSREGESISYSGIDLIRLEDLEEGRAGREHQGWYLCGNPFPAPLLFQHIGMNEKLDGYVYLYEEGGYRAWSLNSNYSISPYTAFFVKISGSMGLDIQVTGEAGPDYRSPAFIPYKMSGNEPEDEYVLEGIVKGKSAPGSLFKIKGRKLLFENLSFPAWLYIADISGNIVFRCELTEDNIQLPLHIQSGVYVACIYTNSLRNQYKFILNE